MQDFSCKNPSEKTNHGDTLFPPVQARPSSQLPSQTGCHADSNFLQVLEIDVHAEHNTRASRGGLSFVCPSLELEKLWTSLWCFGSRNSTSTAHKPTHDNNNKNRKMEQKQGDIWSSQSIY